MSFGVKHSSIKDVHCPDCGSYSVWQTSQQQYAVYIITSSWCTRMCEVPVIFVHLYLNYVHHFILYSPNASNYSLDNSNVSIKLHL